MPWQTQISCLSIRAPVNHQVIGTSGHQDWLWWHIWWEWVHMSVELLGSYDNFAAARTHVWLHVFYYPIMSSEIPPGLHFPDWERKHFAWWCFWPSLVISDKIHRHKGLKFLHHSAVVNAQTVLVCSARTGWSFFFWLVGAGESPVRMVTACNTGWPWAEVRGHLRQNSAMCVRTDRSSCLHSIRKNMSCPGKPVSPAASCREAGWEEDALIQTNSIHHLHPSHAIARSNRGKSGCLLQLTSSPLFSGNNKVTDWLQHLNSGEVKFTYFYAAEKLWADSAKSLETVSPGFCWISEPLAPGWWSSFDVKHHAH